MSPFVLSVFLAIQGSQSASQDEIKDALARAESLYFEARFSDSIQLLTHVSEALKTQPGRMPERINAKLQLALANVGMNNPAAAKSFLLELFALSPNYNLDPQQFPPKVISLANEARVEAAELFYKTGLNDYKLGDLSSAVQNFSAAVTLAPKHEMAAQYLELAENKFQIAEDRVLLDWQRNFDARQFKQAAALYRQIASFGNSAAKPLGHMTAEYRQALIPLVEDVNRACSSNNAPKMNEARSQISDLLPEPSFGEDIRSKMVPCNPAELPAPAAAPTSAPPQIVAVIEPKIELPAKEILKAGCAQVDGPLALTRLKTRVEPEFPPAVRTFFQNSQVTVKVKARIDVSGNVTVGEATGANIVITNAIRTAVERWKFSTMIDQSGPRCVDTVLPILLGN